MYIPEKDSPISDHNFGKNSRYEGSVLNPLVVSYTSFLILSTKSDVFIPFCPNSDQHSISSYSDPP